MHLLTREELKALSYIPDGPAVSIYLPTHRAGSETRENPIRFKNLVTEAEEQLIANDVRAPEAGELLEPVQELIEDYEFWQNQSDGLALFLTADQRHYYRLPASFEELVVVGDRFHLKPLMPLLSNDGRFYLLALSQNEVRLFHGTRDSLIEIELEDMPTSLAEALRFDEPHSQQQFHTATDSSVAPGSRPAVYHGHGVGTDDEKEEILRYFHHLDKGLADILQDDRIPLVLAGVEYLFPLYREANTYGSLFEEGLSGNPENLGPDELHRQAWEILEPYFRQSQEEALAQYHHLSDTGQSSQNLWEIIPAAHYGRVDTLFVAKGQQQWGSFDPDNDSLVLGAEAKFGKEDLLDSAAVQTLLNGGTVYTLEPEAMPHGAQLAAIFRYDPASGS